MAGINNEAVDRPGDRFHFSGKAVLVTGGASGLGRETAIEFGRRGAQVIVADRNDQAEDVAAAIRNDGGSAIAHIVDVCSAASVDKLFQEIAEQVGRLDVAVNAAGIAGAPTFLVDTNLDDFDQVVAINLRGVFLCMRRELEMFKSQQSGAIINIASTLGLIAHAGSGAYCASKHGVIGLTKAGALEVADQGIRVNAVCPAVVPTPMTQWFLSDPELVERVRAIHPAGRFCRPDEIAATICWLASNEASYITGAAIPVDGGQTAC